MTKLSVLDLVPVREGHDVGSALADAARLAKAAEDAGYARYWVAEHHGMAGVAGAATSVVLAHVGAATSRIRIGSGGIMLPNHAPLAIAEQFGTLAALYPGRIDLGLGRAPGSDGRVAHALRRNLASDDQQFPRDVVELMAYFANDPRLGITASPGAGESVEVWILGSSLFGAQLAAMLGVRFAFASHFAPDALMTALAIYRRDFVPSDALAKPYCAAAHNVFAADTVEEAELLATSMQQAFVALRSGTPGKLRAPVAGYRDTLPPQAQAMLDHVGQYGVAGTPDMVRDALERFAATTGVDEVIVAGSIYDPAARARSLELTAAAMRVMA
jgi:luciferase family oxidoreductase group 1